MQPAKPAYPPPPSSYGMGAPQQPVAWNMQHPAPQQPEQDGCLRTSVLVTGIIHIVISIFPTNVLGIIAGCFQITGASMVRNTSLFCFNGISYMTPANFLDFFTPPRILCAVSQQILSTYFFTSLPLCADVIYGSPPTDNALRFAHF